MTQSYALFQSDTYMPHGIDRSIRISDHIADANKAEADAIIASGDYFEVLATTLDELGQSLKQSNKAEHYSLERVINTLLYLQQKYTIIKK